MSAELEELHIRDYAEVYALWKSSDGIGLSSADNRSAISAYMARNPGLSSVARVGDRIVAAVLCGHDGRRGYLHHLAVAPEYRNQGLGQALVERSMDLLGQCGIAKCHIFIFRGNQSGKTFWSHVGFEGRADIGVFSRNLELTPEE